MRRHSSADIVTSLYRSLITMPQRMFSHRDTLQQRICLCVACVSSYVRNLLWYIFLLQLCRTGSLAWSACDRLPTSRLGNSGNTSATPLLIDFASDGLPHCCELALSVCRFRDSLTGYTRRDATWMQLVQARLYSLLPVSGRCRSLTVSLPAYLLTSRPWTSAFVCSWYDSAFLCVGVSCGYLADPEVGLVFVTSPTCNVWLVYFVVPGGGG